MENRHAGAWGAATSRLLAGEKDVEAEAGRTRLAKGRARARAEAGALS